MNKNAGKKLIVPENKIKLVNSDVEELCDILLKYFNELSDPFAEIRSLKTRFSIENYSSFDENRAFSIKRSIQDIVYYFQNEEKNYYNFFSYLVDKRIGFIDDYEIILRKYGYTVEINGNKSILVPLIGETFEKEINELNDYIEKNAPNKTFENLKEAKELFTRNRFDGCLSRCRKSLESMTINDFTKGIDELTRVNLIINKNDSKRKDDGWLLKAIYGFNSTMGSHITANSSITSPEQALFGLMITQSSIRYILKILEEAKQSKIQLQEWFQSDKLS